MKFLFGAGAFFLTVHASAISLSLPDSVYRNLQPGDIIIRKGGGPLSYQLMQISGENYSHCGAVVKKNDTWMVVESLAAASENDMDGVQLNPLDQFVAKAVDSTLFICRCVIDLSKNHLIAARAFHYLQLKVPFDHRFDLRNDDRFYCSELLLHIFQDVFGHHVFEVRTQHHTLVPLFSTFFDESKFRSVYQLKTQ